MGGRVEQCEETADGFLVISPIEPGWKLGPTDVPDLQLGGAGSRAVPTYSFFGPEALPVRLSGRVHDEQRPNTTGLGASA